MIALLNRLFVEILITFGEQQSVQGPHSASQHTLNLLLQDLAANSASAREPWTLPRMAIPCGMGATAFSNRCRSLVNAGRIHYLMQCRLHHAAKVILKKPHRPITEIALECGFNSSQYSATVFGRLFKLTPRDYRKQES